VIDSSLALLKRPPTDNASPTAHERPDARSAGLRHGDVPEPIEG